MQSQPHLPDDRDRFLEGREGRPPHTDPAHRVAEMGRITPTGQLRQVCTPGHVSDAVVSSGERPALMSKGRYTDFLTTGSAAMSPRRARCPFEWLWRSQIGAGSIRGH